MILRDKDIREPLFDFLDEQYGKIRILEEVCMGTSRADVVMVTEYGLIGMEIKSDADSYARLAGQVKDYDKYFDKNIVVVGTSHALHIREHVPSYWGVITVELVEGMPDFYVLQKSGKNPHVEWKKKLELLWRPELDQIQTYFDMPKYKEKSKSFVQGKICQWMLNGRFTEPELQKVFCDILFERDYTAVPELLAEYRKGELQKQIEKESDPVRRMELMMEQSVKRNQLKKRKRKKTRRKK